MSCISFPLFFLLSFLCFLSSLSAKIQKPQPWLDDTETRTNKQDKRRKGKRRTVKKLAGITINDITFL